MSQDIFVFAEQRDGRLQQVSLELLGEATRLAAALGHKVVAVLPGSGVTSLAPLMHQYGADKVLVVDHHILKDYTTEPYTKVMTYIINEYAPDIVLYGATSIGRDLAPRVSARIKTGLTADCVALAIEEDTGLMRMTRPAFGGNLMAEIVCRTHRPQMATVRPGVMKAIECDVARKGGTENVEITFGEANCAVELLEVVKTERAHIDIADAKYLVSVGRGIGGAEHFDELRRLAAALGGGAEISCSRACVDAGWIEKERQVGQTGKTVRPELYIALGISGAMQHLVGMEESELIIAVNKNTDAPIFSVADLGIVGDVHVILPKLIAAIEKARAAKAVS